MTVSRRILLVALTLFLGFALYHAVSPYKWTGETNPPVGVAAQYFSYTCAAPWGAAYVHGPATTPFPLTDKPCGVRSSYQVVGGIDVVLAVLAITALYSWEMRSRKAIV